MEMPRYIDLTTDFRFNRIFSSEPNKDLSGKNLCQSIRTIKKRSFANYNFHIR